MKKLTKCLKKYSLFFYSDSIFFIRTYEDTNLHQHSQFNY